VHCVYFWLRDDLSAGELECFRAGLQSLTTIETVERSWTGVPAATRRPVIDSSYSHALVAWFPDLAAHDAYQQHPTHDVFRNTCAPFWTRVQIYDVDTTEGATQHGA
jgi:Stress responsive A/B Barrel Domain